MLQDIAILTGGEVITDDLGLDLKETQVNQLGRARQIKVQKESTKMCIRDRREPICVDTGTKL